MSESTPSYASRWAVHVLYHLSVMIVYSMSAAYYGPDLINEFDGYTVQQPLMVAAIMIIAVGIGYNAVDKHPVRNDD